MITLHTITDQNTWPTQKGTASYFGVVVEILTQMQHYSLIRHRHRQFIVDTEDLQPFVAEMRAAA